MYLLDNARQALEQVEKPFVLLMAYEAEGKVVLTLEDNGEGFSPECQTRLFEMGYSTRTGARGFGLHYCANAIREMGGKIIVASKGKGKGAKVTLSFPIPS